MQNRNRERQLAVRTALMQSCFQRLNSRPESACSSVSLHAHKCPCSVPCCQIGPALVLKCFRSPRKKTPNALPTAGRRLTAGSGIEAAKRSTVIGCADCCRGAGEGVWKVLQLLTCQENSRDGHYCVLPQKMPCRCSNSKVVGSECGR